MKKIAILFSYVKYTDVRRKQQQSLAMDVLSLLPNYAKPICLNISSKYGGYNVDELEETWNRGISFFNNLTRNSKINVGSPKPLPYIKEILQKGYEATYKDYDIFGYINSDILITDKLINTILQKKYDAFLLSRSDIAEVSLEEFKNGKIKVIYGGDKHAGVDGVFFDLKWWDRKKQIFPDDLICGATEWDTCYRHLIKKYCDNYYEGRDLLHVYHDQKWNNFTPDAINNIKIWEKLKNDRS